jgi:hypothetical protein
MVEPFPEAQIAAMWRTLSRAQPEQSASLVQIDSYGGRVNAVAPEATAVAQRSSIMKLQFQAYWTQPSAAEERVHLDWIRRLYADMYGPEGPLPDGTVDGCYVGYPDVDLARWPELYYKGNYPRLQQAKLRWDPDDHFRHAQSIELPAGGEART